MSDSNVLVVHCKRDQYDVYIGRGKCPCTGMASIWGNPFKIGKDGSRSDVIEKFRIWFLTSGEAVVLRSRIHELHNKRLGCWCSPKSCHGDVLAFYAKYEPFLKRK